jgi:hypothetical protein
MSFRTWTINALLFVTLLTPKCSSHHAPQKVNNATYFVLTGQEAEKLVWHCSGDFRKGVGGYWTPSVTDLERLEGSLNKHLNSFGSDLGARLLGYTRQYAGVVKGGRKLIFVNGFHQAFSDKMGVDLSKKAVVLCDGGRMVYGLEYDVETQVIQNFVFNGER